MKFKNLFFSIIAAAFLSSAISVDKTNMIGKTAPKIETISGKNVVVDGKPDGKTKIVSFWSPKQPASRIANKNLSLKYDEKSSENVEFISICTDSDESLMKEVVKIDNLPEGKVLSYSQISPRVFKDYDVQDSPKAFKISADGKIIEVL